MCTYEYGWMHLLLIYENYSGKQGQRGTHRVACCVYIPSSSCASFLARNKIIVATGFGFCHFRPSQHIPLWFWSLKLWEALPNPRAQPVLQCRMNIRTCDSIAFLANNFLESWRKLLEPWQYFLQSWQRAWMFRQSQKAGEERRVTTLAKGPQSRENRTLVRRP